MSTTEVKFGPIIGSAATIGAGIGGILDITIFHQILQTHQMLSSKIGNETINQLKLNIVWDGFFQLICLVLVFGGILSLWKLSENPYSPRSSKAFHGGLLAGWGIFITLEGIINHILLEIHHVIEHVHEDQMLLWDVVHVLIGVGIGLVGKVLISHGKKRFYNHQMRKARKRPIRFRPAFNRQSHRVKVQEDILPEVHASSNLH